ncbi:ATP-binding cassette domain-containing protein [Nocardioides limicola]|uniref:ATP-binding cassette domain-containing protein n=1 Tax=Nocardioides limicola TaxID=2803368 RepID=UPI00193BD0BC|nr:ATP-binding cassette domain-containing protein [Nocardioides sp. DJM-14]
MSALLEVRDLVIEYRTGGYPVRPVDGFTLEADAGELVVLLGPSGCGKTSLLSAIGGILSPTSGSIRAGGVPVTGLSGRELTGYRQRQVGFVFQAFNLVPSLTARENVAVPLLLAGVGRRAALARADVLLDRVGLTAESGRRPGRLSGGQQQRVAVARGLAADPPILVADEPTANLDYIHAEGIIALLRELRADGRLIVVSTHDDRLAPIADRVIHLVPEFRSDEQPPQVQEYAAGEVIFEQGSRGELVYVVEEGAVEITRTRADGQRESVATVEAGRYFGELGPTLGFPRSATATALSPVRVLAMSVGDFRARISSSEAPARPAPPGT